MNGNTLKTRWLLVALVAAAGVACSSSSNDDNGSGGDDGEVTILPRYEFQLTSNAETPITVQVPMGKDAVLRLTHLGDGPGIFGDFNFETGTFSIFGGSSLVVDDAGLSPVFGDFDVQVTEAWVIPADAFPTSGAMIVRRGAERLFISVWPIGMGVSVDWDQNNDGVLEDGVFLTWDEFDNLPDTAPEWQQLASFAYSSSVDFMLELTGWGIGGLLMIDDALVTLSPIVAPCDAFSGAGLAVPPPPPDIPDQGWLSFTWYDDAASGSVNPGDSFSLGFDYCWMDLTVVGEDFGALYNGLIGMNSWTEVVTNDVLTRTGFEGTSPSGRAGGLVFEGFEIWETWVDMGTTVAHLGAVVDGRMEIVFSAP